MPDRYGIRDGYLTNPGPVYFLDDPKGDIVFQPDVLPHAEQVAIGRRIEAVVDVGCGWAEKLAWLHERQPGWALTGIDYGDNITRCRKFYTWGTWLDQDLDLPFHCIEMAGAVVVASDVIEHLVNPDTMLDTIRKANPAVLVVSTPERDLEHGKDHNGPPTNLCHVREWNRDELAAYVTGHGWHVVDVALTRSNNKDDTQTTTLLTAVPA